MPPEEAGYTYAVEPTATHRLLANEEESIYGHSEQTMTFGVRVTIYRGLIGVFTLTPIIKRVQ
jgi:hypothetical protein